MKIIPKTIKELADELNVSKQTIQYHYQRLPAKNRQKDSQGKNMINLTAERIIRGKVSKNQQIGSKKSTKTSKENNELVISLRREIEDLKSQRDNQLATKDRQIDHLTKLIDQQQQLQLTTVAENRQLEEHLRKSGGSIGGSERIEKRQVTKTDNAKEKTLENITNKKWWHFW